MGVRVKKAFHDCIALDQCGWIFGKEKERRHGQSFLRPYQSVMLLLGACTQSRSGSKTLDKLSRAQPCPEETKCCNYWKYNWHGGCYRITVQSGDRRWQMRSIYTFCTACWKQSLASTRHLMASPEFTPHEDQNWHARDREFYSHKHMYCFFVCPSCKWVNIDITFISMRIGSKRALWAKERQNIMIK